MKDENGENKNDAVSCSVLLVDSREKSKKKVMFVIRVEMKKEEWHWTDNLLYYLLF